MSGLFMARRRKRVRAVDPYLGFYPTSDPLSDAQTTSTNTGSILLADESIQEPQATSQGLRAPEPPTSTIQFVHSSSSPEPAFCQPTAPKASYAARKRRRIDSDSDGPVEAVTRSSETSTDEDEDEEDEEVEAPAAAPTRRSTRTSTQARGMLKPSRPRKQLGTVRGPFATRLIAACLATGAQLNDDLAEINARTVPQLKLTALPLAIQKRRISSTQLDPLGRKRGVNFLPRPSFNTANVPDEANPRNGAHGANKVRKRLSHLPLPLANTRLPSATLAGHEVVSRPAPRKKKQEEAQAPLGVPPLRMASGTALKRAIRVTKAHEDDTLLKEGGLKMTTLRSFDRAARALRTRVKAASTSPSASPIRKTHGPQLTADRSPMPTYVPVPAQSPRSLLKHDSNLMDRSFSPIPVTPARRPHPRPSITQFSPSQAHDNHSHESPPPPTFGTKIPLPFSASTSPQSLSDSRSRIDVNVLVPDSPSPPIRRNLFARTQRSSDAGIFIPASLDMPTSSSASVDDLEAAPTNGNFDLSSLHILVPDSSHVLVSDSIFVPASLDDTSHPSTPSQEEDEEDILVPDSSHVLAPETQPDPPAPARPRRPILGIGAPRRPIMLKSINELSDSFLEKIAKNGAIFGRLPPGARS